MHFRPLLYTVVFVALGTGMASSVNRMQNANPSLRVPVAIFIPGRVSLTGDSELMVRVKGLDNPGQTFFTSPCQIRYTVFTRDGRGVLMYPNAKTGCLDVGRGFSSRRGTWSRFAINLGPVRQANLPSGIYWIVASIAASEQLSSLASTATFVSNTARLEIP